MMILWSAEIQMISEAAIKYGVDHVWIATIRKVENGREGSDDCEFGVVNHRGEGYDVQLRVCCATVRDRLIAYDANPFRNYGTGGPQVRLGYNEKWIRWFASQWAPIGSPNDPARMNIHWPTNALSIYPKLIVELVA